jgi:hypothetical protein
MITLLGFGLLVAGAVVCEWRRRSFTFADALLVLVCFVGGIGLVVESLR